MNTLRQLELAAEYEQAYRRAVVYPTAERRAQIAQQLRAPQGQTGARRPQAAWMRWLGAGLAWLGRRLATPAPPVRSGNQ